MKPIGINWRHARAKLDLSTQDAAEQLGIKVRSLLNIESGQPRATVSERLAYRAARLYGVEFDHLVSDAGNEGVPDEPPDRTPQGPTGPARRKDDSDKRGPKRVSGGVSAA